MSANAAKKEMRGFIQAVLKDIEELQKEIRQCRGDSHVLRRAKGSVLHDFYNACERIFEVIAREVNGGVPRAEQWHKKLLHQMTLPIKGVRPAVISKQLAAELDEYLAFRHLFRNIYGFELEGERLDILAGRFNTAANLFKKEINDFLKKL